MCCDCRMTPHAATGFENVESGKVFQTARSEPGFQTGHFLIKLEVAEVVPFVAESLRCSLSDWRAKRFFREQSRDASFQRVSRRAVRARQRPRKNMTVRGRFGWFESERENAPRTSEVI